MTRPVEIREVVQALAARIGALTAEFFPRARVDGRYCQVGSLAGEPGQSLAVYLSGAKQGRWKDFATGEFGDALDLVAQVLFMGDKRQAVQWSLRWLGHDGAAPARTRSCAPARAPDPAAARAAAEAAADQAEKDRKAAHGFWLAGRPLAANDPVWRYLGGRGIDLAALSKVPGAVRWHPDLWHRGSGRHWPAMVTAIADAHGRFLAMHRTWLEIGAAGGVTKAPVTPNKMIWPGYHGGFIRLARGASGRSLARAPEGEALWICEGVEDGLTLALAAPEARVIAAVSLNNLGNLVLPRFRRLDLVLQNDTAPAALAQRDRAVRALQEKGHEIWFHRPPPAVKDINELLQRGAA